MSIFASFLHTRLSAVTLLLLFMVGVSACTMERRPIHQGMIEDPETGILYGSMLEARIVTEASFYRNPKIKVRVRNTSGDINFDLTDFKGKIEQAYAAKGYIPTDDDDFGLLMNVDIAYSGHIQNTLSSEFAFIGSTVGGLAGQADGSVQGYVAGVLSGAALGTVAGSFVTEDTYSIVARVTFGEIKKYKKSRRRVTFSRSAKLKNLNDPDEDHRVYLRGFKRRYTNSLAVWAGGRNVNQSEIVDEVKQRITRIVSDFI